MKKTGVEGGGMEIFVFVCEIWIFDSHFENISFIIIIDVYLSEIIG